MDVKEIGINTRNCVDSAQDRNYWRNLVNAVLTSGFHDPWSYLVVFYGKINVVPLKSIHKRISL